MKPEEREWWENAIIQLKTLNKELTQELDKWEEEEVLKDLYNGNHTQN